MAYYRICPTCGAALDPGEKCTDCAEESKEESAERKKPLAITARIATLKNANQKLKPAAGWSSY